MLVTRGSVGVEKDTVSGAGESGVGVNSPAGATEVASLVEGQRVVLELRQAPFLY